MRVAVLSHTYVEPESRKKLYAIARMGVDVTLFVPDHWQEGALGKTWDPARGDDRGVNVVPVGVRRLLGSPAAAHWDLAALASMLSAGGFDLLHLEEEPWSLAARGSVRLARRLRVPATLFTWQNLPHHPQWPLRLLARRVLSRCSGWVAGNEAAAGLLRAVDPTRPLIVLPQLGIDAPSESSDTDRRAGRGPGAPLHVGYVGRLVPEKGVADLLAALASLQRDWRATIVGDGPERRALEARAGELGIADRVTFEGSVPSGEVAGTMEDLDALVLPSHTTRHWAEQFGHVLLEGMAAGAVLVGSDSGAIPEVIGNAGMVYPEGDTAALAAALQTLAADPAHRASLAAAGRARAGEFTHERIAERLIGFWESVTEDSDG
jgi:glycosyltransferase involved in cell wall biosynthesis